MYKDKKILAIIPARGGSKGLPGKNIKILNGKPLIEYSVDVAQRSHYIDDVVVSTDCDKIKAISEKLGAKVIKRPEHLSMDTSLVVDAVRYTINKINTKYDLIILLEPTSPLRTVGLVDNCIEKLARPDTECIATFHETSLPPARMWKIVDNKVVSFIDGSNPWLPRQKLEKAYQLNGLVYGFNADVFMKSKNSVTFLTDNITPVITSRELSVDIDDILDFNIVKYIMEERYEELP